MKNNNNDDNKVMIPPKIKDITVFQTIGSTTSMVVSLTFFSVLAYKRDAYMVTFFIGSILNGIMSKVLKKIINQDRPTDTVSTKNNLLLQQGGIVEKSRTMQPSDKGMPSSHAMSLGFIGTFTALSILYDHNTLFLSLWKYWAIFFLISYCYMSLWYRVATQLHTAEQIVVGLSVGITNAILWRRLGFTHGFTPWRNKNYQLMTIQDWVSKHIIPNEGYLPIQYMILPAIIGLVVVGSFERRLSSWLKKQAKQRRKNI